jgi:hypothetical protein
MEQERIVSKQIEQSHLDGGVERRGFLKGIAATGTGVVLALAGGAVTAKALAGALEPARAATAATAGFTFVQITDTHIGFAKAANRNVTASFEEAVRRINALPQRPAFVIHTGDHVHLSRPAEFDTARQIMGTIKADQLFHIPGEHDVFLDHGKRYLQVFGRGTRGSGYFSFDYGGVHFLALANDAGAVGSGLGQLGAEQLAFVRKDLAGLSSDTPLVLFSHVPLLPVYGPWGWATADSPQLLALVARFASVTALNGHIHQILTKRAGNVVMHTAAATSYPDHAPGQGTPTPLTLPPAQRLQRTGLRTVAVTAAPASLALQDRPFA